jgi:putative tryptophan/tyrosine transport system substrate-binding protein
MNSMAGKIFLWLLATVLLITAPFAEAQQPAKVHRIGFLGLPSATGWAEKISALRAGLRDLGYVEGKNLVIEFRWADGRYERLPDLAAELVRLKVDVIVTHATVGTRAAKKATTTTPIVIAAVGDAVALGLVASLARPGGNVTGSSFYLPELRAKRLELLKESFPRINRVAVLRNLNTGWQVSSDETEFASKSLKLDLKQFGVTAPTEFESTFGTIAKQRVDAVAISEDPMLVSNAKVLVDLAAKQRLPSIGFLEVAEAGGLMAYAANLVEMHRRAAYFVDRILKGTKPADLPVEQPMKFEFVINLRTAKQIGLTIPPNVLARADRVIR